MSIYFLVTSALHTPYSQFTIEERASQSILTAKSIRHYVPDSKIILIDGGILPIDINMRTQLLTVYDDILDFTQHEFIKFMHNQPADNCGHIIKGPCESYLLREACKAIQSDKVKRIFKISGRYILTNRFDLSSHLSQVGKYVMLNKVKVGPVEFNGKLEQWADYCYETNLYSFCSSLLDEAIENFNTIITNIIDIYSVNSYIDLETATYLSLNKYHVYEIPIIGVSGTLSMGWTFDK